MRTAHPSEQLGNRLICDSLAISYHSRDIDDTIAEEEEPVDDDEDDENDEDEDGDASGRAAVGTPSGGSGREADEVIVTVGEGGAVLMTTAADGRDRARDRRSNSRNRELDNTSNSRNSGGRVKSRSVSPGYSVASLNHGPSAWSSNRNQNSRRRSGSSSDFAGSSTLHDYVNSAPGGVLAGSTPGSGFGAGGSGGELGFIPAIPPPPPKQQQSFNRQQQQQHLIDIDSDPYGKEFDAISTDNNRISAATAGTRINGRVVPFSPVQQQQSEGRKEFVPPQLRNGFVERAAAWPQQGSTGEV